MVRQWSARWFARQTVGLMGTIVPLPPMASGAEAHSWLVLDEDMAIAVPDASRLVIASMMLDKEIDATTLTDADRQLVGDLATACLDDLCRRFAQAFRLSADARWAQLDSGLVPRIDRPRGCSLDVRGTAPLLRLVVGTDLVIASIKAALTVPLGRGRLGSVAAALANQAVTVSAMIGRCSLTLADMADLSKGDVLVFDRDAGTSLPLTINAIPGPGRCAVEQADGGFHLKILEPPIR